MAKEKELKAKPIHYRATVSNTLFVALNTLFMVLFVIITLYPVLNTLAISFNDGTDALRGGIYLLPRKWSTKNYTTVLQKDNLITGAYISVLRTVIGTLTALEETLGASLDRTVFPDSGTLLLIGIFSYRLWKRYIPLRYRG